MKSSSNSKNIVSDFLIAAIKPDRIIQDFEEKEGKLIQSLLIVVISGAIFLLGIFLAGDLIYNIFYEQYSTFILEQITGGLMYGLGLSRYDYILVFVNALIFIIKMWIFLSVLFYAFLRLFGEKFKLGTALSKIAWSVFPYSWIMFLFSLVSILLKFIFPLLYHYIFYIGIAGIFVIVIPIVLEKYYEKTTISSYKIAWAYYLTLLVLVILWSINHYNLNLMEMI